MPEIPPHVGCCKSRQLGARCVRCCRATAQLQPRNWPMLTMLVAGVVMRHGPSLRITAPCMHTGQPAACRVRVMRANVAEVDQSLAVGDRNAKRVLRTRAFWVGLARLAMCALFGNHTFVHHQYIVSINNCREPVGNH